MPVKFIEHKGKEILYIDHRTLTSPQMLQNMKDAVKMVLDKNEKNVLMIADVRGGNFSNEILEYLKTDEVKKYSTFIGKEALVGITGIKKMVTKVYFKFSGATAKLFDDVETAKEYLVG